MIATEMSTVAPAAVENVEHPGMSREQKDIDPTQQLEVDTSDVSIEVSHLHRISHERSFWL